jgi:aminopeptidase N
MKKNLLFFLVVSSILFMHFQCTTISSTKQEIEDGVSEELAIDRYHRISNLEYQLKFEIPDSVHHPIESQCRILFDLTRSADPLLIDFSGPEGNLKRLSVNGEHQEIQFLNGHLILDPESLNETKNDITVTFHAGELALNRHEDYLYSLFVPDRASSCFPLFDQPDMKARYSLKLAIPENWHAISNTESSAQHLEKNKKVIQFAQSKPISSYLFAFAAGLFKKESLNTDQGTLSFYHMESDSIKVARNAPEVFNLHQHSINWLENYTGLTYPFGKFEFLLIPAFQFGGMEHPGAIWYRADRLLLDSLPSLQQKLRRASLIAHETAHMWFGNLVTMKWFNDVWLKEVFANFMAAKIVNPDFPELNHELRFLLSHYPSAYAVDRTSGANPVLQKLDNLNLAATMYGSIIYQKAPILMKQLEIMIGKPAMQKSLRNYLEEYSYSNATWDDLVKIIAAHTEKEVIEWSETWIKQQGMPTYSYVISEDSVFFSQEEDRDLTWIQEITPSNGMEPGKVGIRLNQTGALNIEKYSKLIPFLPNSLGLGYGYFKLDQASNEYLTKNIHQIEDPVMRGSAWIDLWEALLRGDIASGPLFDAQLMALSSENNPLILNYLTGITSTHFWRLLDSQERIDHAYNLESILLSRLKSTLDSDLQNIFLNALIRCASTPSGMVAIYTLWNQETRLPGFQISEDQFTDMAFTLALHQFPDHDSILTRQYESISSINRKERFEFIRPALSVNQETRDSFFKALYDTHNRRHEPWVEKALHYLHHPTKAHYSVKYLKESLAILEPIYDTGGIFFPLRWLNATFSGHQTSQALSVVDQFLEDHPYYPDHLKMKILQATDLSKRAHRIKSMK